MENNQNLSQELVQDIAQPETQKRKGFTLTEAAIVLGIVGLILGAIWVAAAAVYNNLRVNRTSQQLLQMVQAVRAMHATQQTIDTGTTTQQWIEAGIIPQDLVGSGAGVTVNQWGGSVNIAAVNGGAAFQVIFGSVPKQACTDLLVKTTGQGRDTGLTQAGAGATYSFSTTSAAGNFSSALNAVTNAGFGVTTALSECSGTTNIVGFEFNLKS